MPSLGLDLRRVDQRARDSVTAAVFAEETHCHLCLKPVDKHLRAGMPASPEVDEIIPVSLGGDPLQRSNCRLAHKSCNARRGNMTVAEFHRRYLQVEGLVTSHAW
jgi:5-methylcytosine-specific restriction endonuclease McrA